MVGTIYLARSQWPSAIHKKVLEVCNTLAEPIKQSNVVLFCPIPQYVMGSCCTDPAHIENQKSEDFEDELADCQEQHKRVLGGWAV
jgi:UDP-N-acetylglucosamine pyrophosphorylase